MMTLLWFKHVVKYFLGDTRNLPPQGRVNAGQKLHHIGVVVLSSSSPCPASFFWIGPGAAGRQQPGDGSEVPRPVHARTDVLLVGHLYFTFVYEGLSAMTTGYVSEEYARVEHAKWLASFRRAHLSRRQCSRPAARG